MKRHLNMESDTDSTNSQSSSGIPRLGKCEVCNFNDAKYTCPKCEVKTCRLNCLNIHKKELNCDGIRDRTKYIPLNKMTKLDFMSDYNFLEECTRYVQDRKNDKIKRFTRYNKSLPTRLFKLRTAAREREITLRFLLANFTKRKINTTYHDGKEKIIYWRIEWIFYKNEDENWKYVDEKCSENDTISMLLDKYLNVNNPENVPRKKELEQYQLKKIKNINILLKAEGVKNCKNRFYRLDFRETLKRSLAGKTIVEFPTIYLCLNDSLKRFSVIDSDEDVKAETKQYRETLDEIHRKQLEETDTKENNNNQEKTDEEIKNELRKLLIEKKREERYQKRLELEKEPQNYLFTNERLLELLSDSSDTETEDEGVNGNGSNSKNECEEEN